MSDKLLRCLAIVCGAAFLAGCGTIYTVREYGPQQSIVAGSNLSKKAVLTSLGAPNAVYEVDGGENVFVYHTVTYKNILGLYAVTEKSDLVLTLRGDSVIDQQRVDTGETTAIVGYQLLYLGNDIGD